MRSSGLNQRSLTNGRQRPISTQPRATPWGYGYLGLRPERAKAFAFQVLIIAFALSGRNSRLQQHPGRCPGLMALSPFRGIMQTVGLIPFKQLYIHRVRGVYRTTIFTDQLQITKTLLPPTRKPHLAQILPHLRCPNSQTKRTILLIVKPQKILHRERFNSHAGKP